MALAWVKCIDWGSPTFAGKSAAGAGDREAQTECKRGKSPAVPAEGKAASTALAGAEGC